MLRARITKINYDFIIGFVDKIKIYCKILLNT